MIRAGLLALVIASPAAAEGLTGQALCDAVWAKVVASMKDLAVNGRVAPMQGDWCVVEAPLVAFDDVYPLDWQADRLRFTGSALGWLVDGSVLPERLEIEVEGLRMLVRTGIPQMDWLFAAQARPNRIEARAALSWDAAARSLRLDELRVDFPGENLVELSATATGVDLSSDAAVQMSATGFALTGLDLHVETHGLFEWYALMTLGPMVMPQEGDMDAAAEAIRADLLAAIAELPATSFSAAGKAALVALVQELPNPAGDLVVAVKAAPGIGPVRLGGYVMTGVPATVAAAAPVFEGVKVDVGWTHADAP